MTELRNIVYVSTPTADLMNDQVTQLYTVREKGIPVLALGDDGANIDDLIAHASGACPNESEVWLL